jgi:hypothetical protein
MVQFMYLCEKELSQLVDQVEPARLDSLLGKKKEKHIVLAGRLHGSVHGPVREGALPASGPGGAGQARLTPRQKEGKTYSNWQGDLMVQFTDLCEKELSQLVDQVEPARLDSLLGKKKEEHIVTGRETSWFSSWTCARRSSPSSWTRWSRPGSTHS